MPRPRNKQDLLKAGEEYYAKLIEMADGMSEKEMNTEFDFSGDPSKKERHWGRDKNLRDIWVHLYEWHRMLLEFVDTNLNKGGNAPFLPEPYTWKTYGDMNVEYWKKHQKTSLENARKMFEKSEWPKPRRAMPTGIRRTLPTKKYTRIPPALPRP